MLTQGYFRPVTPFGPLTARGAPGPFRPIAPFDPLTARAAYGTFLACRAFWSINGPSCLGAIFGP